MSPSIDQAEYFERLHYLEIPAWLSSGIWIESLRVIESLPLQRFYIIMFFVIEIERPVVSAVGLETALKEVGVTRLFRSHSEVSYFVGCRWRREYVVKNIIVFIIKNVI